MSKSRLRSGVGRSSGLVALGLVVFCAACEDDTGPGPAPADIEIVSGNGQYSKQGTELEDPVVVQVTLTDGEVGSGVTVSFSVRSGGGSLSRASATTNSDGQTSVRWTLGPTLGAQQISISVTGDAEVATVAQATAGIYSCPEEDPTFVQRFSPSHDLFLFSHASSATVSGGTPRAGVVHLGLDLMNTEFDASSFVAFDWTVLQAVVRDCAFSQSGEFYIAWTNTSADREIAKVAPDRSVTHFATLEGLLGTEITWIEDGVLGGVDEFGPFTVGCRDTLTRYADATFIGTEPNNANFDAVAYDAAGDYLYFIDRENRRLKRIPLDGYTQTGATEEVVTLEPDESTGAVGMAVHTDGAVYLVVESAGTKAIVKVVPGVSKEIAFDFFSRGGGNAAGIQDDLAIDSAPTRGYLYTLDTLNNVILLYRISDGQLFELDPDGNTDPNAASSTSSGERVGLAVLPGT
ncbi:MAG TPA: Ig-like domain-containing protein [Candidatus Krumholzibacteria bacterium]|nr:Ig-like domain-containing protein [Candidatus Krumholzibacteria bacterium]